MKILPSLVLLATLLIGGRVVAAADLQVVVLDVGMGQSILLTEGGHGLLVDTGLAQYVPQVLSRMEFYGVNSLDYLVLSHLHPDHAGGYFGIRKAWPDTPVLDNCHNPEDIHTSEPEVFVKITTALERDPLRECLAAGDTLHWRGHEMKVLWPESPQGEDLNHNSLVLLFTSRKGGRLLIMGDVDRSVESRLTETLRSSLDNDSIDLYVAGHHAAMDSTDPAFLSMLQPQVSVVSVGQDNQYGYPSDESMRVLETHSNTVLRTDRNGEICFVFNTNILLQSAAVPAED
jgi:competence protein ComEC